MQQFFDDEVEAMSERDPAEWQGPTILTDSQGTNEIIKNINKKLHALSRKYMSLYEHTKQREARWAKTERDLEALRDQLRQEEAHVRDTKSS